MRERERERDYTSKFTNNTTSSGLSDIKRTTQSIVMCIKTKGDGLFFCLTAN